MTHRFSILIEFDPAGPGYVVSVPSLPGCFTQGATIPESVERAKEAISGHIASMQEVGEEIPKEDTPVFLTSVDIDTMPLAGD